ncbi:hypothetical protein [Snuella lapsa]|uniref:Uncharacterized protein n=1 Tax=Snuella lapsa TaxID=870481 RepID=A0ABP6XQ02_9FLAO
MKKSICLIISILFVMLSLSFMVRRSQIEQPLYFYFNAQDSLMSKKYSGYDKITSKGIGSLKYIYLLENDNIIFTPKEKGDNPKRLQIASKDTLGFNVKTIKWLKNYNGIQRDSIFLRKGNRKYYVIEKQASDNKLYMVEVVFIQETE